MEITGPYLNYSMAGFAVWYTCSVKIIFQIAKLSIMLYAPKLAGLTWGVAPDT